MYFHYFRGRQFELIGLRELIERDLICNKVIPILEPIKLSSTLISTIEAYIKKQHAICVIRNPQVGSFFKNANNKHEATFGSLLIDEHVINSVIVCSGAEGLLSSDLTNWLLINNDKSSLNLYEAIGGNPRYTLIPDTTTFRRRTRGDRVLLEDVFEKQARNKDYGEDEFFSDNHLNYVEDYVGFSDYSIVGDEYTESGFAPLAVAIHIVYFKSNDLWIKHFVSESNEDIHNPAGKFNEAVAKLARWVEDTKIELTYGLKMLLDHQKQETYPGLGTVKKLTIMHHMELMSKYLSKVS